MQIYYVSNDFIIDYIECSNLSANINKLLLYVFIVRHYLTDKEKKEFLIVKLFIKFKE